MVRERGEGGEVVKLSEWDGLQQLHLCIGIFGVWPLCDQMGALSMESGPFLPISFWQNMVIRL